ncbi:MAG TPA: hypothetical protein ENI09_01755 [candidate division WWE3 bacterium]|uniref:EamA domain-containing protein n=1 Tax=candidate division WWE3 bacterium TaxID=2053526 RepID=A0A7C1NN57_UNCKA|nr:hypothetical protein [candidate division WWE3 bacterium]
MTWLYLALTAALFWAVGQVLVKKGFENVPPLWNNIIFYVLALLLWVPASLWLSNFEISIPTFPVFFIIALAQAAYMIFFYAIVKGELALTGTIVAGYPVTTVVLSQIFLGERLAPVQVLGITLVLLGAVAISLPERGLPKEVRDLSWIKWGVAAAILIGFADFLSKISINQIGSYSNIFFLTFLALPLLLINYLVDKKNRPRPKLSGKKSLPTLAGNLVLSVGTFVFYLALGQGDASLVVPVSSIYPAFIAILAMAFLREKVTVKQGAGIVSAVLGIILTGLGS